MKDLSIKRIVGIVLSVVGVLGAIFALVYGAVRDTESVVEVKVAAGDSTFVATAPGVLALYPDSAVKISAAAPDDGEIMWGIGRSEDVQAYLRESSYTQFAGLDSAAQAKISTIGGKTETKANDAQALKSGALALEKSDLWEKSGRESSDLQLEYRVPQGAQRAFIATTTTGTAPDFTIQWSVKAKNFPAAQIAVFGILLALIGIYLMFTDSQSRARINYFRKREAQRKAQREAQADAATQILPVFKGDLAAPETDREVQRKHTEGAFGASILPGTARTQGLRERPLAESDRLQLPDFTATAEAQRVAQQAAAAEAAKSATQLHAKSLEVTAGALGAAIIAGSAHAQDFRNRPLAAEDRVVIPVAEVDQREIAADTAGAAVNAAETFATTKNAADVEAGADTVLNQDNLPQSELDDWKSLWNFAIDDQNYAVTDHKVADSVDESASAIASSQTQSSSGEPGENQTDLNNQEEGGENRA